MSLYDLLPSDPDSEDADAVDTQRARCLGTKHLPVYLSGPTGDALQRFHLITQLIEYAIAHDPDDPISYIRKNSIKKVAAENDEMNPCLPAT